MTDTPLELAASMGELLDRLGIPYAVGGSVASSVIGEPRSTIDIDMAVRLQAGDIDRLLEAVEPTFYVPLNAARLAAANNGCFNLIHNDVAYKIDLFVLGSDVLDVAQIERRILVELPGEPALRLWITSPEDQVLRKLDWFKRGGETSQRQWSDVLAILRINRSTLDSQYLDSTALQVGLDDLLGRALAAAET